MIQRATLSDHGPITEIAAEAYASLGDYRTILPTWLNHPGVVAYVDRGQPGPGPAIAGFCLLGFFEIPGDSGQRCIADLLAIAVVPERRRQGVGRRLLDHAIHVAGGGVDGLAATEIRLTVAETNGAGQGLFTSAGFRVLAGEHGSYQGGQRAIRMGRLLDVALERANHSGR